MKSKTNTQFLAQAAFFFIVFVLIIGCSKLQNNSIDSEFDYTKEEQAIMEVLKKSAKAYYEKDVEPWKSTYVQEPYQIRLGYWEDYKSKIQYLKGWDTLYNHKMRTRFERKRDHEWDESTQEIKNMNLRIFPEVAWATFEQASLEAGTKRILGNSVETRVLEKKNGEWKIAYLGYMYYPKENAD